MPKHALAAEECGALTADERPGQALEDERRFWNAYATEIASTGLLCWASVPVTFTLAWYCWASIVYTFILLKFFGMWALQRRLVLRLHAWLSSAPPERLQHWRGAYAKWDERRRSWWPGACGGLLLALQVSVEKFLDFVEAVDPDFDTLTAANAHLPGEASKSLWRQRWRVFPVVGYLGVCGVLSVIMVASVVWQLFCYRAAYRNVLEEAGAWPGSGDNNGRPHSRRRSGLLNDLQSMADIAGLFALASMIRSLQISEDVIPANRGRGSTSRIFPETIGSAWFTVSLLSIALSTSSGEVLDGQGGLEFEQVAVVFPAVLSLASSFVTAAKALAGMPVLLRWHRANMKSGDPDLGRHAAVRFYAFSCFGGLTAVAFAAIAARFCGIWICRHHDFEIHRMRCHDARSADLRMTAATVICAAVAAASLAALAVATARGG